MANSKLTKMQKEELRDMMMNFENSDGCIFSFEHTGVTVGILPIGKTVRVALSIMSLDEEKFRAKVGKFVMLGRFQDNQYVIMNDPQEITYYDFAYQIAYLAAYGEA